MLGKIDGVGSRQPKSKKGALSLPLYFVRKNVYNGMVYLPLCLRLSTKEEI